MIGQNGEQLGIVPLPRALDMAQLWIADRRTSWERRLDRLGDYLDESPPADPDTRSTP